MKHLKLFHLFTGLLAFFLVIASITGLYQPSPETANPSNPVIPLLLMAALVNLMSGAYLCRRNGVHRWLQVIGSILLFSAIAAAVGFAYNSTLMISGVTFDQITLFTISSGTLFHVLASLNNLFTSQPEFKDGSDWETNDRETGSVKWFNVTKGFGFITRDVGDDIFVHYRAIRGEGHRTLSEGQRVEFTVVEKDKGLQAEDVIAAPKGR
ncbi:cold-shock protein [Endozoicomonas elysicola]|uniref:CSD domain-containing protein n=1 Tax=Endozoicomonas elysicola TaxID=305900 RepID=A0A081KE54_9GAMM|nr:hypothetical protein GV64_18380 [Endozoicomonas elysicola]